MTVAIVDYGSGNLHSAHKAFERAVKETGLMRKVAVTSNPDELALADHIVLPGVGAFADCKRGLASIDGMIEALNETVRRRGRPFLGICVGMQLMGARGLEHEITEGLNWIGGDVAIIRPEDPGLKVPHMGWNTLQPLRAHPILGGIETGERGRHAYFVHSFQLTPASSDDLVATTDYGGPITAIVGRDNMVGAQFHPEKSQALGLAFIANFLKWRP